MYMNIYFTYPFIYIIFSLKKCDPKSWIHCEKSNLTKFLGIFFTSWDRDARGPLWLYRLPKSYINKRVMELMKLADLIWSEYWTMWKLTDLIWWVYWTMWKLTDLIWWVYYPMWKLTDLIWWVYLLCALIWFSDCTELCKYVLIWFGECSELCENYWSDLVSIVNYVQIYWSD